MATMTDPVEGFVTNLSDDQVTILRVDQSSIHIDRRLFPFQIHIGDFIIQIDESHYRIDQEITELRRKELRRMSDCFFD